MVTDIYTKPMKEMQGMTVFKDLNICFIFKDFQSLSESKFLYNVVIFH